MAEATHLLGLPKKHKPKDIKPQGAGSGLDADKVDGLHASEIGGGGPHASSHDLAGEIGVTGADHLFSRDLLDAPSWFKTFSIPYVKDIMKSQNPVISKGSWERIAHPNHILVDGKVYIFYTVRTAAGVWDKICCQESSDFENFSNEVTVLQRGGSGAWDEKYVMHPKVIYDPFETDPNKKFKMWYEGFNAASVRKVGYAYCSTPNGAYTKYAGNPLTMPADHQMEPFSVVRLGDLFYGAYYDTSSELSLACSSDGINWTAWGKILNKGGAGEWDFTNIHLFSLTYIFGTFYLVYTGYSTATGKQRIGMAERSNPFGIFDKFPYNPIIQEWSGNTIACPSFFQYKRGFKFYYWDAGSKGIHLVTIGAD